MSSISGPGAAQPALPIDASDAPGATEGASEQAPGATTAAAAPASTGAPPSALAAQLRPTSSAAPASGPSAAQRASGLAAIRSSIAAESKLPLQPGGQSILMAHDGPAPRGTLVLLHGFSVGPWQFQDMAKKFYDQGYDVYIPRLPGECLQKGTDASGKPIPDVSQLPMGSSYTQYHQFVDQVYAQAKALGQPISVAGLSAGGALTLDMAERHPDIQRAVCFSPFIEPAPKWGELAFDASHAVDKVTFGGASELLDQFPYSWSDPGGKDEQRYLTSGMASDWHFKVGNIDALDKLGEDVTSKAASLSVPVQFIMSASDKDASPDAAKNVFDKAGNNAQDGWYEFPASDNVPHAMVSPKEYGDAAKLAQITDIASKFLTTGQATNRDGS
jgi:pimeloyl-ACP methyl ester carboxylesterase